MLNLFLLLHFPCLESLIHHSLILLSLQLLVVPQRVLGVLFECDQLEVDLFEHYLKSDLPDAHDVRRDKDEAEKYNELRLLFQSYT